MKVCRRYNWGHYTHTCSQFRGIELGELRRVHREITVVNSADLGKLGRVYCEITVYSTELGELRRMYSDITVFSTELGELRCGQNEGQGRRKVCLSTRTVSPDGEQLTNTSGLKEMNSMRCRRKLKLIKYWKGLSHEIFMVIFWLELIYLGLIGNCFWFFNFKEGPSILDSQLKYGCVSDQTFSEIRKISKKDWQLSLWFSNFPFFELVVLLEMLQRVLMLLGNS